jgi:hypothetical protein
MELAQILVDFGAMAQVRFFWRLHCEYLLWCARIGALIRCIEVAAGGSSVIPLLVT